MLLTPEVIKKAGGFLSSGCFEKHVYTVMRIAKATWYSWKEKGQTIETMLENGVYEEKDLNGDDHLFLQFMQMCRRTRDSRNYDGIHGGPSGILIITEQDGDPKGKRRNIKRRAFAVYQIGG